METSTDTTHSSKPKTVCVLQMAATCQCLQRELAHVCTPCKFRNRHAESEHVGFTAERACSVTLMPFAKPAKASLPARDSTTSSLRKPLVSRVGVSRSLRLAFRRASSSFSSGLIMLICPCAIRRNHDALHPLNGMHGMTQAQLQMFYLLLRNQRER